MRIYGSSVTNRVVKWQVTYFVFLVVVCDVVDLWGRFGMIVPFGRRVTWKVGRQRRAVLRNDVKTTTST